MEMEPKAILMNGLGLGLWTWAYVELKLEAFSENGLVGGCRKKVWKQRFLFIYYFKGVLMEPRVSQRC